MRFLKLNALILSSLLLIGLRSIANEKPAEGEAEGGKEPGPTISRDQREYQEKSSRLNTLLSRIEESEKQFAEAVEHKNEEKNPEEKQRLIKRLVEITKERNKSVEDYNKLKTDLDLRYPNRGERSNKRYEVQSKKSVEEMEGVEGLDELLTHTAKLVKKKFASFDSPEDNKKRVPAKAHATGESEDGKPKKLKLEK
jgi:hypothetical protein